MWCLDWRRYAFKYYLPAQLWPSKQLLSSRRFIFLMCFRIIELSLEWPRKMIGSPHSHHTSETTLNCCCCWWRIKFSILFVLHWRETKLSGYWQPWNWVRIYGGLKIFIWMDKERYFYIYTSSSQIGWKGDAVGNVK